MSDKIVNSIAGRLSLRQPQFESLDILARITEIAPLFAEADQEEYLAAIAREYPNVKDFERDFPSLCFALATGVGKTRLMGAFISYLHLSKGIKHFFVLAPNLTIYNKLITDFTPNTPKYVFQGISEFATQAPLIVTGDNYEQGVGVRGGMHSDDLVHINIFNISKINAETRGGKSPRMKRLSEYIGESYFDYLAGLPDLVLLMDESHRYRGSAGVRVLNELKPKLGLELTATPFVETPKAPVPFQNVIYNYPLARAMEDGFVKEPAVVTQKNFDPSKYSAQELEKIKLEDGVRLHENTKVELETYARGNHKEIVKPFMLVVAKDTTHAAELLALVESEAFFEGRYKGKAIQVDSSKSGAAEEEMIERLLSVEKKEDPTEIVIHVNMLKEGWDVTNLYTIVPLRAANARTLVEQSIGRGLRLPYGRRTGVSAVDRLNIVAHDRFQEIVDEAARSDSVIQLKQVYLDPKEDLQQTATIQSRPVIYKNFEPSQDKKEEPLFKNEAEQEIAKVAHDLIHTKPNLGSSTQLNRPEVQHEIAKDISEIFSPKQLGLDGMEEQPDIAGVVQKVIVAHQQKSIDIPSIHLIPKEGEEAGFKDFQLDCANVNYQPVSRDLVIQSLRTREQESLKFADPLDEKSAEHYLVEALSQFDDISYDEHADQLFDLSTQLLTHLRSYLSDDDARNVAIAFRKELAEFIHAQMLDHQWEKSIEYEAKITRGFTRLKESAFTAATTGGILDFKKEPKSKANISKYVFNGFQRCLYDYQKFDSDAERRFAMLLEIQSQKWFRPLKGQFQIFYKINHRQSEYIPDFVAECEDVIYMIEVKANDELKSPDVLQKKEAALKWCEIATEYNAQNGGKPWRYLMVPHDMVQDNMTLDRFTSN